MMSTAPKTALALLLLLASTGLAQAACPPARSGDTAAVVAANQQRLICLNREAASAATDRQRDMQIRGIENSIQTQQLQRRLDALPRFDPPHF